MCYFLRLGQNENECLLVTMKTDGNGTVVVKPDFNKDKEPYRQVHKMCSSYHIISTCFKRTVLVIRSVLKNIYIYSVYKRSYFLFLCRIVTDGEKREVWRLTVENVSTCMKAEEKEKEQNMYKDVSPNRSRAKITRTSFKLRVHVADMSSVRSCTLDTRTT